MKEVRIGARRLLGLLAIILALSGCPPDDGNGNGGGNEDEALRKMEDLRYDVLRELGGVDSVPVLPFRTTALGRPEILNCEGSLQQGAGFPTTSFPENLTAHDESRLPSYSTAVTWRREYSNDAKIGFKIVSKAVELAFKNSRVQSLEMRLSIEQPLLEELRSGGALLDAYSAEFPSGIRGNVLITGLVRSNLRLEYEALDDRRREIGLDLALEINKDAEVNGAYVQSVTGSDGRSAILETDLEPTVLAALYLRIPENEQDIAWITTQADILCDGSGVPVTTLIGFDPSTQDPIASFELTETPEDTPFGEHRRWFVKVSNISGRNISVLDYQISVKNPFGQLISVLSDRILFLGANSSDSSELFGPNSPGRTRVFLEEARLDANIRQVVF